MTVVMIDGPIISRFIDDSEKFGRYVDERFKMIDQEHRQRGEFSKSDALDGDDEDCDDRFKAVDLEGYRAEMKAMMEAVAQGMGGAPVLVVVEEGSLLMKAYEAEIARIEQEEKKKKEEKNVEKNREERENGNGDEIKEKFERKMRKKKSRKFLNFCACSGKHYAEDT